jgi:hypothetical protein
VGEHFELNGLGEISKVEVVTKVEGFAALLENAVGERRPVGAIDLAQLFAEGVQESAGVDPLGRNEEVLIEVAKGPLVLLEVSRDLGQVTAEERLAHAQRFQEGQAKAFRDGGGDEMARVGEPVGIGRFEPWGGGDLTNDAHLDREMKVLHGIDPLFVDCSPSRILRSERNGEGDLLGREAGKKTEFAEILATDPSDRIEHGGRSGGLPGRASGHRRRSDRIGQEGGLLAGNACFDE